MLFTLLIRKDLWESLSIACLKNGVFGVHESFKNGTFILICEFGLHIFNSCATCGIL